MHTWPVQYAKARFSEFLDACINKGPQVVTRRSAETAVLVPIEEWRRLQAASPVSKTIAAGGYKPAQRCLCLSGAKRAAAKPIRYGGPACTCLTPM